MSLATAFQRDKLLDERDRLIMEIPAKLEQLIKKDEELENSLKEFMLQYLSLLDVIHQNHDSLDMLQKQIVDMKDILVEAGIAKVMVDEQ